MHDVPFKSKLTTFVMCNSLRIVLIFTYFLFFTNCLLESHFADEDIFKIVKRNLICREKEYLKTRPLSENLKDFIKRAKRHNKGGEVVPFKQLSIRDTGEYNTKGDALLQGRFTVVPLIIPRENTSSEIDQETTCIDDEEMTTNTTTTSNTTALEKVTDEYDMVPIEATTKGELIGKVIKDIKELVNFERKSRPQGEASLCNVTGDWDSFAGGMQLRITFAFANPTPKVPRIAIVPLEPPGEGFLTDNTWNATGVSPFPNSSMISLTMVSSTSKKIATFLGECRICDGSESVTGFWMLRRRSKNCKDREEANAFFSDVLRKNNVRRLQHEHLEEIASTIAPLD